MKLLYLKQTTERNVISKLYMYREICIQSVVCSFNMYNRQYHQYYFPLKWHIWLFVLFVFIKVFFLNFLKTIDQWNYHYCINIFGGNSIFWCELHFLEWSGVEWSGGVEWSLLKNWSMSHSTPLLHSTTPLHVLAHARGLLFN